MTAEYIGEFTPGSPEWHTARHGACGGSDVAAILGLSKWESHFSLWHRMAGRLGPQPENDEMRAGRFLEAGIIASFADLHPQFTPIRTGLWRNTERTWQIASPDAFLLTDTHERDGGDWWGPTPDLLETKFALYDDEWGEPGTDQIPPYYLTQTRWYLDVFDARRCFVHVFIGSAGEFRTYIVEPNAEDQQTMRKAVRAFLDSIHAGERPDIDEHSATYEAVRRLHPGIEPVDVEIPAELGVRYILALNAKKHATAEARRVTAEVADAIGDGRRATHAGSPLAIRVPGRGDNPPFIRPARGVTTGDDEQ